MAMMTENKQNENSPANRRLLAISHIIRKVLQCETLSLSSGNNRWFRRSTGEKRQQNDDDDDDDDDDIKDYFY